MRIKKHGVVILTEGPVRIEGWQVEREPDDPADATSEQLLLDLAIDWAWEKLRTATNRALAETMLKRSLPKLVQ